MRVLFIFLAAVLGAPAAVAQVPAPPPLQTPAPEDPMVRLQRLEAERDIERALYEYGRAFDEGDFDAYVGLFAENGVWFGGLGEFRGRDAIRGMLSGMEPGPRERLRTFHLMSNPLIVVADGGLTATSVSRWTFFTAGEDGAPRPAMSGRYFDAWVKVDGRWLIARREAPSDIPFDDLSNVASGR